MNTVMIIPTGIGCEIGGHAGDATPAARLLGSVSEDLFLHPNVVNGSDINEMPANALYIEGSMLDRFLVGAISLRRVTTKNRIIVVVNDARPETINAVSATRATLGADITMVVLNTPLLMQGWIEENIATGSCKGIKELVAQMTAHDYDALAIATPIDVDPKVAIDYFKQGGTNPWGGIEAIVSRRIATAINKPCAHSPVENYAGDLNDFKFVIDPRMAAEVISECYLHCILKGLHRAPRVGGTLTNKDVDVMVSPMCEGRPHVACREAKIPIIYVKENTTRQYVRVHDDNIYVANYLEAAGMIACMGAGIDAASVRRPLTPTEVLA